MTIIKAITRNDALDVLRASGLTENDLPKGRKCVYIVPCVAALLCGAARTQIMTRVNHLYHVQDADN